MSNQPWNYLAPTETSYQPNAELGYHSRPEHNKLALTAIPKPYDSESQTAKPQKIYQVVVAQESE